MAGGVWKEFFRVNPRPEFLSLMARDRSKWPRCFFFVAWLVARPLTLEWRHHWAVVATALAVNELECALGVTSFSLFDWRPMWDPEDIEYMADLVAGAPNIWTEAGLLFQHHLG